MASSSFSTHALVLPFPTLGHINPCLLLSQILASSNHAFLITFLLNTHTYQRAMADLPPHPRIRLLPVPHHLPPTHLLSQPTLHSQSTFAALLQVTHGMRPGVEHLLHNLQHQQPPVTCIIADTFVVWSHHLAAKFQLPLVLVYSTNAHACSLLFHAPSLISKGLLPFKGNGSDYDPDYVIDCVPGVPPLHPLDFPSSMRFSHQFSLAQFEGIHKAEGIILNTFYELESEPIDALQKQIPVFPIGLLLLLSSEIGLDSSGSVSYWPEDDKCLQWLDSQPPSSVVYVSFGSVATMPTDQVRELAQGLESSEQPFLWVIRPNGLKGSLSEALPEGFTERTKARGLIITWAPQLRVLSHPSVGGFLTHCGWNSLTENLCTGGVPMICWPHVAEQRLNCRLLVDVWKMGEELRKREDGMVEKGEVERAVRAVMQEEGGKEKKRRAAEMKERGRRAVEEGGSSMQHLKGLIEAIRKKAAAEPI